MKKLTLLSLAVSAILIAGCGGGDSTPSGSGGGTGGSGGGTGGSGGGTGGSGGGSGGTGGGTGGINNVNGIDPIAAVTIDKNNSYTFNNRNISNQIQGGYEGDIQVVKKDISFQNATYSSLEIQLSPDVASLNVADVQREFTIDMSCDNGFNAKGTVTSDFSTGRVVKSGTYNGQTMSCESLFQTPLPRTITDLEGLDGWGDDDDLNNASETGLISTTCPQDDGSDDNDPDFEPLRVTCSGSMLTNYTVTTTEPNKVHKFFTKTNW